MYKLGEVKALTFDVFGTILDLGGSLIPYIAEFLSSKGSTISPEDFWNIYRGRQRIEQYQDTLMMLSHSGYLETSRRAFVYSLGFNNLKATKDEANEFMQCWQKLSPFPEVKDSLQRLQKRYKLVVLSNGDPDYLEHLVKNRIKWTFDYVFSVQTVGAFKPHPSVYRKTAEVLNLEVGECGMVSSNSFDIMGARACGFRAAFVDRYKLPYEDSVYTPDVTVSDFTELADFLL
jgi:2-haloacid dehalogenase